MPYGWQEVHKLEALQLRLSAALQQARFEKNKRSPNYFGGFVANTMPRQIYDITACISMP